MNFPGIINNLLLPRNAENPVSSPLQLSRRVINKIIIYCVPVSLKVAFSGAISKKGVAC